VLRRALVPAALVLAGAAVLLVLPLMEVDGIGVAFGFFAVQAIFAVALMRSLWAPAIPASTAVVCAAIGFRLVEPDSEFTFPVVLSLWLLASLPGVLVALLGAFALGERSDERIPPAGTLLVLVTAAGLTLSGCGGGSTGPGDARGDTATATVSGPAAGATAPTRSAGGTPPGAAASGVASTAPRSTTLSQSAALALDELRERAPGGSRRPHARTLPDGAVVIPPPTPTAAEQPASDACDHETVDRDGVPTTVEVPPAPGLRSEVAGDIVRVTVDTGRPPPRCAPDYLSVRVQVGADLRAPISRDLRLRRLGEQRLTFRLPAASASVADGAVRATTGTDSGRVSPTTSVALE
jgi:hypothetical protein